MSGRGVRTTVVHPERHVPHFVLRNTRRPREEREVRCDGERGLCPPPDLSPRHSLPPIYTTFFRPLSLSLSFCSPSKSAPLAPLQPSSARSRVRESCISIFFRWSKRGPFGSCSRIPHCLPLSRLFLSLSLSVPRLFLSESPGAASHHERTPF